MQRYLFKLYIIMQPSGKTKKSLHCNNDIKFKRFISLEISYTGSFLGNSRQDRFQLQKCVLANTIYHARILMIRAAAAGPGLPQPLCGRHGPFQQALVLLARPAGCPAHPHPLHVTQLARCDFIRAPAPLPAPPPGGPSPGHGRPRVGEGQCFPPRLDQ